MYKKHTVSQSIDSVQIENIGTRGANSRVVLLLRVPVAGRYPLYHGISIFRCTEITRSADQFVYKIIVCFCFIIIIISGLLTLFNCTHDVSV